MKKSLLSFLLTATVVFTGQQEVLAQPAPGGGAAPVITEIMYNPPEAGNDTLEFLEIHNPSLTASIDMSGYFFSSGIEYTFPSGFTLAAGEFVVIAGDSVIFETWYGVPAFEWDGGTALSNSGEGIALRNAGGIVADTVFYDDNSSWPDADGSGFSLVLCDPTADNNLPENWSLSENATGIVVNGTEIFADPGQAATCTATSMDEQEQTATIVYPNPTEGPFQLRMQVLDTDATLRILNSLGQEVSVRILPAGTTSVTVNESLKSGYYVLSIERADSMERMRLTVQ